VRSEESTTPDLVELTRSFYETMDRDWDFDSLAGFSRPTQSGICPNPISGSTRV
jgi:hypothetical protein